MTIDEFAKKAIGVPFKAHGRDWNGWDCWGELCVGFKEVKNIILPDYTNNFDIVKDKDAIAKMYADEKDNDWLQVNKAKPMDVILMYMYGRACHVGLAIDKHRMLHVEHGINTCVQNINTYRIEGIYRYVKWINGTR